MRTHNTVLCGSTTAVEIRGHAQCGDACTGIIDGSLNVRKLVLERSVDVLGLVDVSLSIPFVGKFDVVSDGLLTDCLGIPKFWTLEVPGARVDLT